MFGVQTSHLSVFTLMINTGACIFLLSKKKLRVAESKWMSQLKKWMVKKYLSAAGLGNKDYSTHKLRHTAATLMYQSGQVDIRVLKDILGHAQLNTTQIYTHVSNKGMEEAMAHNPLADMKIGDAESETEGEGEDDEE